MGQHPVSPVNIPIPTKIGSQMGGAPTPKWDPIGFDSQPFGAFSDPNPFPKGLGQVLDTALAEP